MLYVVTWSLSTFALKLKSVSQRQTVARLTRIKKKNKSDTLWRNKWINWQVIDKKLVWCVFVLSLASFLTSSAHISLSSWHIHMNAIFESHHLWLCEILAIVLSSGACQMWIVVLWTCWWTISFFASSLSHPCLTATVVRPVLVGVCYWEPTVCSLYILTCSPTFIPSADCLNSEGADRAAGTALKRHQLSRYTKPSSDSAVLPFRQLYAECVLVSLNNNRGI